MEEKRENADFSREVLNRISEEELKQISRINFLIKEILVVLGVVLGLFLAVFLFSLALFQLRLSGLWFAGRFGIPALAPLLVGLPWLLLLIVGVLALGLETLLKRFGFCYRRPLVYSFLIVTVSVVGAGFAVEKARLHQYLFDTMQSRKVPASGILYKRLQPSGPVYLGYISTITPAEFVLAGLEGKSVRVFVTNQTATPQMKQLETGDFVLVLGSPVPEGVLAKGVRLVDDEFLRKRYLRPEFR